jgi:hypothetical protein
MNLTLPLDGFDCGPLFAPVKKERPLARPHGLQGTIRRRQERERTPPWARTPAARAAIRILHAKARQLTEETGVPHVVDHVVPLIGKLNGVNIVSGLHVAYNMQVSTRKENGQKREWWWPDMPVEQLELL